MSFYTEVDRAARDKALYGPPRDRARAEAFARRVAPAVVERLKAHAKSQFHSGLQDDVTMTVTDVKEIAMAPSNLHVTDRVIEEAVSALVPGAFSVTKDGFTMRVRGSLDEDFKNYSMSVRIDFKQPLR